MAIRIQELPFRFLAALLERPGELITREELRARMWPPGLHLDFESAVDTAARKARRALGDSPRAPRYIQTLPGRGYRFLAPVAVEHPEDPPAPGPPGPGVRASAWTRATRWALPGLLFAGILGFAAWRKAMPAAAAPHPPHFTRLTSGEVEIFGARLAADGREVLVGGAWDGGPCRLTRVDPVSMATKEMDREGFPLAAGAGGAWALALRPTRLDDSTGTFLGTLAVGGLDTTPKEVMADVLFADLDRAGNMALVRRVEDGFRLECPAGTLRVESWDLVGQPRFSPDGAFLAFLQHRNLFGWVALLDLRTGAIRRLTAPVPYIRGLAWRGEEVWFTAGTTTQADLHAVDLRGATRVVYKGTSRFLLHDIGRDGRVLLSHNEVHPEALVLREGEPAPKVLHWKGHFWLADLDAGGRKAVGWHMDPQGRGHVLVFGTDGGEPVDLGLGEPGSISLDGRWIAAPVPVPEPALRLLPLGLGPSRTIPLPGLEGIGDVQWMPDGRSLLFRGAESGRPGRLFRVDVADGSYRPLTAEGTAGRFRVSPDGRRISVDTKRGALLVDLQADSPRVTGLRGILPGEWVAGWTQDSRSLFIHRPGRPPLALWQVDPDSGRRRLWKTLPLADRAARIVRQVRVAPDGRTIAVQTYRNPGTLFLVEGLR
ncbi:MAG: winged helix-turn-helix domain-containing protein [Acidobacteria bacterium]|nr:winged helix-turn-helix domain-containing protein [Acidobacteriota bacterium]